MPAEWALAQPPRIDPSPLPAITTEISGKTYMFEDNPFGWHTGAFSFQDGGDEVTITANAAHSNAASIRLKFAL